MAFVATRPARSRLPAASAASAGYCFHRLPAPGRCDLHRRHRSRHDAIEDGAAAGQHTVELKLDAATRSSRTECRSRDDGVALHRARHCPPSSPRCRRDISRWRRIHRARRSRSMATAKGRTPLNLADVQPGEHVVAISNGTSTVNRKVSVDGREYLHGVRIPCGRRRGGGLGDVQVGGRSTDFRGQAAGGQHGSRPPDAARWPARPGVRQHGSRVPADADIAGERRLHRDGYRGGARTDRCR